MTDHEQNDMALNWVDTPVRTDLKGDGVRQIRQTHEWGSKTKISTFEMVKDTKSTKIVVKYHHLMRKLEVWSNDKLNELACSRQRK